MSLLGRGIRAAAHWCFEPISARPIACTRMLLGASMFGAYLLRLPQFGVLYGADSVAGFSPFREFFPNAFGFPLAAFLTAWGTAGSAVETVVPAVVHGALLFAALAFTLGFWTRTSGALLLLTHLFLLNLNPFSYWGWSQTVVPLLLFTVLADCGAWASLDRRRAIRSGQVDPKAEPRTRAWPVRLVQIHVAAMYAEAGFARLDDAGWQKGEMLYAALVNRHFTRFDVDWAPWQEWLRPLCWMVFLLEPLAPFLLWIPKIRIFVVLSLIGMHLGLETLTRVGFWNGILIAAMLAFLPMRFGRSRTGEG